jgi:hypothetical protein
MIHSWKSVVIGGVLPIAALLVVMPLLANTSVSVAGIPLLFAYVFALFPLTSLCLWVAWRIDEPRYRDREVTRDAVVPETGAATGAGTGSATDAAGGVS